MKERGPSHDGLGKARLTDEQRAQLRGLVASMGLASAARSLHLGISTLERAVDPYELMTEATLRRILTALARHERPGR